MESDIVKISPKFQVVIPKKIREDLKLKPGKHVAMIKKGEIVYIVPVGKIEEAIGIAKGVTREGLRDERDRFD